jgi:predicted CopG family antitoxin
MSRLGAKGFSLPRPDGSGFLAPFVKALENKKSSEIALRLNSYKTTCKKFGPLCYQAMPRYTEGMLHELTIIVDDVVYQTLKPMVEQQTIGDFLSEFLQTRTRKRQPPSIAALRGTLHCLDTSDLREEADRPL